MTSFKSNTKKTNKKMYIILACVVITAISCISIFIRRTTTQTIVDTMGGEVKEINVLVSKEDIAPGVNLLPDFFDIVKMPNNFEENEIPIKSVDEIKGTIITDYIYKGEVLKKKNIVSSKDWIKNDERFVEHTFNDGALPITVPNGTVKDMEIDIVLGISNAKDKVVLAKKKVLTQSGNTIGLSLTDKEIEQLKESAIEPEGSLYVIAYLYDFQKASKETYMPSFMINEVE